MKSATPLALLRRIALKRLPLILTDDRDLKGVGLLVQAGFLNATMQVVVDPLGGSLQVGVVIREITRSGWIALE